MGKKRKHRGQAPPYWSRKHLDGDWMRVPLGPGSEEFGVPLCPDRRMARRLTARGAVVPVRGPIEGEEHAVVITDVMCWPMPMAEAFGEKPASQQYPNPAVVIGADVLMLLAGGRSVDEVISLYVCGAKTAHLGREWWEERVRMVRGWAEEQPVGTAPPGLVAYLDFLRPDNRVRNPRYAAALVTMAAGRQAEDRDAAGWVLWDSSDLARRMAEAE